jgi:hypothetical protein
MLEGLWHLLRAQAEMKVLFPVAAMLVALLGPAMDDLIIWARQWTWRLFKYIVYVCVVAYVLRVGLYSVGLETVVVALLERITEKAVSLTTWVFQTTVLTWLRHFLESHVWPWWAEWSVNYSWMYNNNTMSLL